MFKKKSLAIVALVFLTMQVLGGFIFSTASAVAAESSNLSTQVLGPVFSEDGKWYWQLKVLGSTRFAGSWEKESGSFESISALKQSVVDESSCRAAKVQEFLNQFTDQQSFLQSVRYTSSTQWVSDELQAQIKNNCIDPSSWKPKSNGRYDSDGNWVALLPYSQFDTGSHEFFVVPVSFAGSSSQEACKKIWPDGTWNGFDCEATIGEGAAFTVKVPDHSLSPNQLQGPPVAALSFFDQSAFSTLKPIDFKVLAPTVAHSSGAVGVLTVLVSFPTMLLSKAIDEMHGKVSQRERFTWMNTSVSGLWALALFFVAAIIDGFSDPNFGFNYKALRILITGFLAFVVMDMGRNHIAFLITKKHSGQEYPLLTARPFFLLVVAGTVIFARVTNIDPTMVFGSVVGLELGARISAQSKGVVKLATTGYTFMVGVISWLGYSWLTGIHLYSESETANLSNFQIWLGMCQVSTGEFLSMLAVAAFSTVPMSMLPFAGLGGKPLMQWKRWVWVVTYFVGLLGFVVVVLPMPKVWSQPSEPVAIWATVLAIYAVVSFTAFGIVTARNAREAKK
ncbi:MAG: hypothetical protein WCO24_00465 [Actinomycetes bacterium]